MLSDGTVRLLIVVPLFVHGVALFAAHWPRKSMFGR
jgi:hypothetical protein